VIATRPGVEKTPGASILDDVTSGRAQTR